jgi:hypothetical protein
MNPADSMNQPVIGAPVSVPAVPNVMPPLPSIPQQPLPAMPPLPNLQANATQPGTMSSLPPTSPVFTPSPEIDSETAVVPSTADDKDLIEKEWVDRAKQIAQANLDNPFQQSRELSKLKAEYMKKRYNKDIRQSE